MPSAKEVMWAIARSFNEYVPPEHTVEQSRASWQPSGNGEDGLRPGDDFNSRAEWGKDVLFAHGWKLVGSSGARLEWQRPGKDGDGLSATTGYCKSEKTGNDLLYVFSTNGAPFTPLRGYDKFSAYATLNHAGDFKAAAQALGQLGYGTTSQPAGKMNLSGKPEPLPAIVRIPASQLQRLGAAEKWLWQGIIPAEMVTIISALPKAGKTTLMSHLIQKCGAGGAFCGKHVRPARVVYITEESETIWAERRDNIGLEDHCEFILRPFRTKPTFKQWEAFLSALTASLKQRPAELLVVDTLAKLWPVVNENDASEVTAALMPLQEVAYGLKTTLNLVHHLRKSDGLETTQTRGSGGITAAVDCIIELRRYTPGDRKDKRRVIHCDSRYDDRVDELVVELMPEGYRAHGDRAETASTEAAGIIEDVLPRSGPGMTWEEIAKDGWGEGPTPTKATLVAALQSGLEAGLWRREGAGKRGSPFTYWRP